MNIVLYYNKSERNKIDKNIEEIVVLQGNFRDSVSILRPRIVIELDNFIDFNYAYIEDLHRYYFVNNIVCVRDKIYLVECSVDVLMSYKEDILEQSAFVERSSNIYDTLLHDAYIVNNVKRVVVEESISQLSTEKFTSYEISDNSEQLNCVLNLYASVAKWAGV